MNIKVRFELGLLSLLLLSFIVPAYAVGARSVSCINNPVDGKKVVDNDTVISHVVTLDEIIVKGVKQEHFLGDAGASNNLSHLFLQTNEIKSVKELTSFIPNFYMPDYGSKQNSPVYIRGIGSKINAPSVGFYVDGIPHFEKSAFDIDLSDVSNIEVLRGPQGTLYGRNAIGGIVNIYTHSPLDYQHSRMKLGYGSRNDLEVSAANYTKVNNHFGFSLVGNYHQNDGFFRNAFTGEKADDIRDGGLRLSVVWKPSEKWTLRLGSSGSLSKQGGYPYGTYNAATKEWGGVNYDTYSSYRRTMVNSGFTASYEGKSFIFNNQLSNQFLDDKQNVDQDFTPVPKFFVQQKLTQRLWSEEMTFKSKNSGRYHWITGLFLFYQKTNNTVELHYLKQNYSTPKYYAIPTYGAAIYHQSSYDITNTLTASIGLRYDYESSKNTYEAYKLTTAGVRTPTNNFDSRIHYSQFTPKFTLLNRFGASSVYASVTRGYKAGGFNLTFQKDDERSFDPEHNWNYEVGTHLDFLGGQLKADIDLFYIDWSNQQISRTVPGVGNIQCNAGHSDSKGVELSIAALPLKGWNLRLDYGYTYARFLNYQKSDAVSYTGNMLPMVPRHTLSVTSSYTIFKPCRMLDNLTFATSLTGVGKIYWTEDNAAAQSFYALLNMKVMATKGRFTWEIWSKNMTNTDYVSYYFVSTGSFAQKGKPFSLGTSILINI